MIYTSYGQVVHCSIIGFHYVVIHKSSQSSASLLPGLVILAGTPDVCCPDSMIGTAAPLNKGHILAQASVFIKTGHECEYLSRRISHSYPPDSLRFEHLGRVAAESYCLTFGLQFHHVWVISNLRSDESGLTPVVGIA
jgi:hypothetical protein